MRLVLLLAMSLLAGCTLVDRRTFEGPRSQPSEAALAARPARPPLAISDGVAGWPQRLADAARDAATRNPAARFDLLAPVPLKADPTAQAAFRSTDETNLQQAATALAAAGIDPDRIRLGLVGDAGSPAPNIRLYVR